MEERTYKIMARTGAFNLVFGILAIVSGVTCGVLLIVSGAKLLHGKSKILF